MSQERFPSARQRPDLDPAPCPTWCGREHLGTADDARGFHHDGPVDAVPLSGCAAEGRPEYLYINLSCHEQRDRGLEPTYVEIQDHCRTLVLLTPAECVLLAEALLERASILGEEPSPTQALFSLK